MNHAMMTNTLHNPVQESILLLVNERPRRRRFVIRPLRPSWKPDLQTQLTPFVTSQVNTGGSEAKLAKHIGDCGDWTAAGMRDRSQTERGRQWRQFAVSCWRWSCVRTSYITVPWGNTTFKHSSTFICSSVYCRMISSTFIPVFLVFNCFTKTL